MPICYHRHASFAWRRRLDAWAMKTEEQRSSDAFVVARPLEPTRRSVQVTFRVRRVSDLTALARVRMRLWLAWSFAWRTWWASFDWYVSAETVAVRASSGTRLFGVTAGGLASSDDGGRT